MLVIVAGTAVRSSRVKTANLGRREFVFELVPFQLVVRHALGLATATFRECFQVGRSAQRRKLAEINFYSYEGKMKMKSKLVSAMLVLSLCLVGTASATVIDDFDTNDPGNYAHFEIYLTDGVMGFASDGSVFTPDTPGKTEGWVWTGSPERLDVGEIVTLDVVSFNGDSEAAILLSTADVAVAGTAILELRHTSGYTGDMMQVLRPAVHGGGAADDWAFGDDDLNNLAPPDVWAPAKLSVTRSGDTTFDWSVTGATAGSGSYNWPDAAGIPLFFGMDSYNGNVEMDNLTIIPEPGTIVMLLSGLLGLPLLAWRRRKRSA